VDRTDDLLRVLSKHIEDLARVAQGFGVTSLAALLLIPILTAAIARQFTLAFVAVLLSLVSLLLFFDPTSATSSLAIASGLGSFLVAFESIVAHKRTTALKDEIADVTRRLEQLENAEHRRLLLEVKARHETTSNK
jgi:K+-sensing histidine kinase KdpD